MADFLNFDQAFQDAMKNPMFHAGLGIMSGTPFSQAMQQGMQTAGGIQQMQMQREQEAARRAEMERARLERERALAAAAEKAAAQERFAGALGLSGMGLAPTEAISAFKLTRPEGQKPMTPYQRAQLELEERGLELKESKVERELAKEREREEMGVRGYAGGQNVFDRARKEGLSGAAFNQYVGEERKATTKIREEARLDTRKATKFMPELERAKGALKKFKTGRYANFRGTLAEMGDYFGFKKGSQQATAIQELRRFQDKLAIESRQPGSGPMSDRDLEVLQGLGVNINNTLDYNEAMVDFLEAAHKDKINYARFLQEYTRRNETAVGAANAWRDYNEANPIISEVKEDGTVVLNKNRQNWRKFMKAYDPSGGRGGTPPGGAPAGAITQMQPVQPAVTAPPPPPVMGPQAPAPQTPQYSPDIQAKIDAARAAGYSEEEIQQFLQGGR